MIAGIDCGNGNLKIILSNNGQYQGFYQPNIGVKKTLANILREIISKIGNIQLNGLGITGAGRHFVKQFLPGEVKTEILCQYKAITRLYPQINTILEIGKEDSKVIMIRDKIIDHFLMNTICSGGVGNYIENICFRFNLTLDEFDSLALKSNKPIIIPSKCAVFGMSSALNYLQRGEETKDIVAGVVKAVARNLLCMIKGKQVTPPCVFTGGGALLKSLKKAFEKELEFEIMIPDEPIFTGAYGASLYAKEDKNITLEEILSLCYN